MLSGLSTIVVAIYVKLYTYNGPGHDVTIYRPQCPPGFCFLGDYAQGTDDRQPNYGSTLCLKDTKNSGLVAHPIRFDKIWDTTMPFKPGESDDFDESESSGDGSGASGERDDASFLQNLTFWKPRVPSNEYNHLGFVITTDNNSLPGEQSVCVAKKTITVRARLGRKIWSTRDISLWLTALDYDYLKLDTFDVQKGPHVTENLDLWSLSLEVVPPPNSQLLTKVLSPQDMALLYQDFGSRAYEYISIYIPQSPWGYIPLGHYAERGYKKSKTARVLAVKETGAERGLLVTPIKYRQIWNSANTKSFIQMAFWQPIAPPGYHCMGDLATIGFDAPPTNSMACLHWSTTRKGRRGVRIWWNRYSPWSPSSIPEKDVTLWRAGYNRNCQSPNTFIAFSGFNSPSSTYMYFHCLPVEDVGV